MFNFRPEKLNFEFYLLSMLNHDMDFGQVQGKFHDLNFKSWNFPYTFFTEGF